MSEKRRVFYLYSKDPSKLEDGSKNPVPRKLRQRRQVIAGVIENDVLRIGKSECSHLDVFRKVTGRNKAVGVAIGKHPNLEIALKKEDDPGKLFVAAARDLITPAPVLETITRIVYRKAK